MATTISDLQALGYTCGLAHGDVATEETALAAAQADADPQAVVEKVNQMTADTVQTLANIGKLPDSPADRLALATQIGTAALEMLTDHVNEQVDFHQRALEIAKTMPDVWHVDGPGVALYISCKEDGTGWDAANQATLDALADPTTLAEQTFQADHPDAMAAAAQLVAADHTVDRDRGSSTFTVDGKQYDTAGIVQLAAQPSAAA